jgi:hypothetical protein
MAKHVRWLLAVMAIGCGAGCNFPRPADVGDSDAADGGTDAAGSSLDAAADGEVNVDASPTICSANQPLRCDSSTLVRCSGDGMGEVNEECLLGCNVSELRCNDVAPSNGLAVLLDMAASEPDLDLRTTAQIDTDSGAVLVNGNPVAVRHALVTQAFAPSIRVLSVRSLISSDIQVTGANALAIVSHGELQIAGLFAASARGITPGAGAFSDGACDGGAGTMPAGNLFGGAGGGGFGTSGGRGGPGTNNAGVANGGAGGAATGNDQLIPLRGGCSGGPILGNSNSGGRAGGAIQLVSRRKITISGIVAVNGGKGAGGAGGSGGGILLEAPIVEISGSVVANGAGGTSGCFLSAPSIAEDGRLDAMPAAGGASCNSFTGAGGRGGARDFAASIGATVDQSGTGNLAAGGCGGGSVGRIRVNTVSGGLRATGLFSPNPSTGTIATR